MKNHNYKIFGQKLDIYKLGLFWIKIQTSVYDIQGYIYINNFVRKIGCNLMEQIPLLYMGIKLQTEDNR